MSTDTPVEYNESTTITLEWTLRGLRNLFDSSKGDGKSKVTKSTRFGPEGRWQILFYANSGSISGTTGPESSGYVSLYLACEPTLTEREAGVNGKWARDGLYNFRFEIKPIGKTFQFNSKEAHNRSFSSKTANLGWAQFALRDSVYYQAPTVKAADCFVVICTITNVAGPPAPPPSVPRQIVPRDLMETVGALLDDPLYSDVEFILLSPGQTLRTAKRIYAASKVLKRAEYFDTMFNSGFSEALPIGSSAGFDQEETSASYTVDDSDAEDQDDSASTLEDDNDLDFDEPQTGHVAPQSANPTDTTLRGSVPSISYVDRGEPDSDAESTRNVRSKISHPSSPRSRTSRLPQERESLKLPSVPGPRKMQVVVRDASYTTYLAVLYYIYTNSILFAPLSSSFLASSQASATPDLATAAAIPAQTPADERATLNFSTRTAQQADGTTGPAARSRKEWIMEWEASNSGRPRPCSAKAVYRLADRLDLRDLKERAFQHIIKSLTVGNVPYEAFSNFSATYEEVRKVQISYFLDHWSDIRGSDAMQNIWQQIRLNRHPGFEQVWPLIALNLEVKPRCTEENGEAVVTEN